MVVLISFPTPLTAIYAETTADPNISAEKSLINQEETVQNVDQETPHPELEQSESQSSRRIGVIESGVYAIEKSNTGIYVKNNTLEAL